MELFSRRKALNGFILVALWVNWHHCMSVIKVIQNKRRFKPQLIKAKLKQIKVLCTICLEQFFMKGL